MRAVLSKKQWNWTPPWSAAAWRRSGPNQALTITSGAALQSRRTPKRRKSFCGFCASLWHILLTAFVANFAELYFGACRNPVETRVWPPLTISDLQVPGEDTVGAVKALAVSEGAELVRRCRAGDGAAWEEIVQTYSRRIYNLAYRFTSRSDTAEDLTQEVFVRVYRSLDQYDPKQGDLQNWLMRLARNLIIDDYRKRQRTPHDNLADDLADHTYHLHTRTNSVQKEMERRELGAQVQAGIDKLSPDLRTCVILRDIEELSYQEIVDLLKIPEGTVKSRINRGRIELAKILRRMKVVAMSEA
jgi:RNA polymerase sigma-70 factor (ECF subfamily)